ncbi:MAG: hypothetical protein ACE5OQ_11455 [Woeseia sp.]
MDTGAIDAGARRAADAEHENAGAPSGECNHNACPELMTAVRNGLEEVDRDQIIIMFQACPDQCAFCRVPRD